LGGTTESRTYDAYGAEASYTASFGSSNLYSVTYTRDALGRIASKTERVGAEAAHTLSYGYDLADRLSDVSKDRIPHSHYAYDPNGNRIAGPGLTSTPAYDAQDRLLSYSACSYTDKASGELQTKTCADGTTAYDYDALGNLRHVGLPNGTQVDYLIDGLNRRVGKKVNGVLAEGFLYDGRLRPVAWLDGTGVVKATFVYGLHANVPEYMVQGTTTYRLITDQVGSVRLVVNISTGAVTERIDWDEFGNVLADSAPGTQPFGYAGGLRDVDTGLTRFGARDYDAVTGRWTAKDPLRFGGGLSLYSYAGADPVNMVDPTGLDSTGLHWGFVWNPTDEPLHVFGGDACGHQVEWVIPPHSTSLAPGNPFDNGDVDGMFINGEIIKIRGVLGSWIHLPASVRPSSYRGALGFLLRGFGWNPIIPDFEYEFGPLYPPGHACSCGG
jgi:RHS repeat-associated protein